jgi:predicted acetyltransferase
MSPDPIVRAARKEELETVLDLTDVAFHRERSPARAERLRDWTAGPRPIVAEVDGELVGTAGTYDWTMSVPGGTLPVSGVTIVTVLPTHRRRGILRAMMVRLAADAREAGLPVAALWASEGTIYGRFGYGPAAWVRDAHAELRGGLPLRAPAEEPLDVRLVHRDDAHPAVAPIFERARARRPGLMSREDAWWTGRILADPRDERTGAGPLRVVVTGEEGYALYRVREAEETGPVSARTIVEVDELVGVTAEAERTLLTFLSRIDLADELLLRRRPVDDALLHAPVDGRALAPRGAHDALWVRILDLPAAVAGRSWAAPLDLVLEVEHLEDELVAGTWALRGGPGGATAERTERPADLALHARDLGSLYLGGVTAVALRDAGVLEERRAGAASALDAALRVDRAPWTLGVF